MPAKGRAYTMKELKGIVDYLTDHNAYGEIRARKMWMDYASTGLTSRTWQSLKETFLKRILPDIYNPYYKLTKDQIRSFRIGQDVTNTNVNALEIHRVTDDESASKDNNTAGGQPSTSYNVTKEESNTSGEENQVSKVTSSRESVETVILSSGDCFYDNAELLKVLESPAASPHVSNETPKKTMSLRDCITYSEPLIPLLQEIVDDFVSEPEDSVLEPIVIIHTQKDTSEKTVEKPDCIDLTIDSQEEVERPQITVKGEEAPYNEVTEDGIKGMVSEVSESSTKTSLKLKKGSKKRVTKTSKKIKNISSESNSLVVQEVECSIPQQINKDKVTTIRKKTKNLSTETNSSEVQVEKTASKEINEDKVCATNKKTKNLCTETNSLEVHEVENTVSKEINKKGKTVSARTITSDVQVLEKSVPEEINNHKVNETNKKPSNLSVETNVSDVQEVQNAIPEKTIIDKTNNQLITDTNCSDVQIIGNVLTEKNYNESQDKTNKETIETNGSDLQIIENVLAKKNDEESATSKRSGKESFDIFPFNDDKTKNTAPETQNTNKVVENSSSTITDSLLPNNQEALLHKTNDKETPQGQVPKTQKNENITTEKNSSDSKTDDVMMQNAEKQTNKVFKKSHKRQRKLYSTSDSTNAISKVKKTIGEVNEESEDEQPSTSKKLKAVEENATNSSSKPAKIRDKVDPKPVAETCKDPVEVQQEDISDTQETHQSTNPCLQSVSLFAEQFIQLKSESDEDDSVSLVNKEKDNKCAAEKNNKEQQKGKYIEKEVCTNKHSGKEVIDSNHSKKSSVESVPGPNLITKREEIVMLKSHSDSESTEDIQLPRKRTHREITRHQKKEVLNDLFGNTSGGVIKKRHRRTSYVNGSGHRKNCVRMSSESSEWVSESDDEYVSPPRCRHRNTKRYLRPKSSRILQMRQEGALFVAVGKKVFPLVRDDGRSVSYVNYVSGSESEENDSYWKLKYVKERKRNDDLSKLLEKTNGSPAENVLKPTTLDSPILPTKSSKRIRHISSDDDVKTNAELKGTEVVLSKQLGKQVAVKENKELNQEKVKIKFAKNNEEVCLEGHWQNLHTILSDVMQVFNKDSDSKTEVPRSGPSKQKKKNASSPIDVSSGKTTPMSGVVDEEVRKKVDKLESEIFKEIEEIDKSEKNLRVPEGGHITVRKRGQPKKLSVESPRSSDRINKRAKTSETDSLTGSKKKPTPAKTSNSTEPDSVNSVKRKTRSTVSTETDIADAVKRRAAKLSVESEIPKQARLWVETGSVTDSEIIVNESRLQLIESGPGPSKRRAKPPAKLSYGETQPHPKPEETTIPDDSQVLYKFPSPASEEETRPPPRRAAARANRTKTYLLRPPEIHSDNTQNSIESSQGYQDSDFSPQSGNFKRKKKYSLPTYNAKNRNKFSRNFRRRTFNHFECDASSESSNSKLRFPIRNITITNSSLNTEVYRSESYQFLLPKPRYDSSLERITESPCPNQVDPECGNNCLKLSPASQNLGSELGNSSSISLPMSPELSIVEHISVSKSDLERQPKHPTINETISNVEIKSQYRDSYVISTLDVSIPLMQQTCNFHIYQDTGMSVLNEEADRHSVSTKTILQVSEIQSSVTGATATESLLDRMDTASIQENVTTNDLDLRLTNLLLESAKKIASQNRKSTQNCDKENFEIKKQSKKRCSTPRKRRDTKMSQTPTVEPVIEECMEYCHSGRKSCPPVICDNSVADTALTVTETKQTKDKKIKTPKEIIKVKITRPKNKTEARRPNTRSQSRLSVLTDSGITDTSILQSINESVDLIHNHSETCLHGNDCLEFMGKPEGSVDSVCSKEDAGVKRMRNVRDSMTPEFFCCDAQSASSLDKSSLESSQKSSQLGTQFHSAHCSSLMTEDLSDEPPPASDIFNNWYLLSEDESTNTLKSFPKPASCSVSSSYGSNLRKLFPEICSVPNLSDITEFSRETDVNSRKSTRNTDLDSNMGSDFFSSEFNNDFMANANDEFNNL